MKKKRLGANHASYVSKSMWKAVMRRTYLENDYLKNERTSHWECTKNIKLLQQALQKGTKNFFNKLNTSFVNDNKLFRKTFKRLFSSKGSSGCNIKLAEKMQDCKMIKKNCWWIKYFFLKTPALDDSGNFSIINQNFQNVDDPLIEP